MARRPLALAAWLVAFTLSPVAQDAEDTAAGDGGAAAQRAPARLTLQTAPADEDQRERLEHLVDTGRLTVEAFFGAPFPESATVSVHPDRAAFTASFPAEWGLTETACWMVAYGVADRLSLLSPRVWSRDACEHDPEDGRHVQLIVTHELVHVFHGQHNPTRDFTGIEDDVGWFAEGLAVHASGQLAERHSGAARVAIDAGLAPERLATAWSGPHRYGVCGSIVAYVDETAGRDAIVTMLSATSMEELLAPTGMDAQQLLDAWQRWVLEER